ncbi:MAG: DUF5916 domain-containing protein [Acidobacteriota bacterium]
MRKTGILLMLGLICLSLRAAQSTPKKVYTTHRVNPHAPTIDGKLDDAAWEKIKWAGAFVQREPLEGKAPTEQTAFRILYDDKNLYVAVRAYDSQPDKITSRMSRRDNIDGDWVEVSIDSYHDHLTAFSFGVNAAGVKADQCLSDNGENEDEDWNPIWDVETAIDSEGWTAEMRIPFSQLRFGKTAEQVWGLQLVRKFFRNQETSLWQFIPKDSPGWVHMFGELRGLSGLKPPRQVELTPYTVGKTQSFRREAENPFATGRSTDLYAGLDGKVGVTGNLTLDFTLNPDFGQVEADPSVVNLTAFETFYEEKRPFFIEGRNILNYQLMGGDGDFSQDNLFYSRRIGRAPQGYPEVASGSYVDLPESTSIIGALKMTGKTRSGLSVGLLDGVTAAENAAVNSLGDRFAVPVEPLTNYFALRLQKDYHQGDTIFGAMLTAVNRNLKDPGLNFLHDTAYSGGLDFYRTWKNKSYFFSLKTVFSRVEGSPEAILRTQKSSVRYFQRPDADHVELDPGRTHLSGHGGTMDFGKFGGGHLSFVVGMTWRSPGLELNDVGYLRSGDLLMQYFWVGYRIWKPFSIFREVNVNFNEWRTWNFGGENIFTGGNVNFSAIFNNYWRFGSGLNRQFPSLSQSALRGGPSLRVPGGWSNWLNLQTDSRKKWKLQLMAFNFWGDLKVTRSSRTEFGLTYIPSNAVSLTAGPTVGWEQRHLQYVGTAAFEGEDCYLLGRINQKTLGMSLRLNWSITPDLTIQYYGQPFISAGKYSEFKRVTEPRAQTFEDRYYLFGDEEIHYDGSLNMYQADENRDGIPDYAFSNPNFNFRQFRSNLVFRWEYRPGSVVYLVWSQGRTGLGQSGDFAYWKDVRSLFDVHPHNVFLVKFSYFFEL